MGLDVYVGTLTRYYCGEWETILQQVSETQFSSEPAPTPEEIALAARRAESLERLRAAAAQIGAQVIGPEDARVITDRERRRLEKDLTAWRRRIARELKGRVRGVAYWDESPTAPYFTDKPGWDSYGALVLWAAHTENPEIPRPEKVESDWTRNRALEASATGPGGSQFGQLVNGPEIWLPFDFSATFETRDLFGKRVTVGSCQQLVRELNLLNDRTWRMGPKETGEILEKGPDPGGMLEPNAKFAMALFSSLGENALAHRLPMKLDY